MGFFTNLFKRPETGVSMGQGDGNPFSLEGAPAFEAVQQNSTNPFEAPPQQQTAEFSTPQKANNPAPTLGQGAFVNANELLQALPKDLLTDTPHLEKERIYIPGNIQDGKVSFWLSQLQQIMPHLFKGIIPFDRDQALSLNAFPNEQKEPSQPIGFTQETPSPFSMPPPTEQAIPFEEGFQTPSIHSPQAQTPEEGLARINEEKGFRPLSAGSGLPEKQETTTEPTPSSLPPIQQEQPPQQPQPPTATSGFIPPAAAIPGMAISAEAPALWEAPQPAAPSPLQEEPAPIFEKTSAPPILENQTPVAPSFPPLPEEKKEENVSLNAHGILSSIEEQNRGFDLNKIPHDLKADFPISLIEPQLSSGKVLVQLSHIRDGVSEEFRTLFENANLNTSVNLPLEDLFNNLPLDVFTDAPEPLKENPLPLKKEPTIESQQNKEPSSTQETFETPFSLQAEKDTQNLLQEDAPPVIPPQFEEGEEEKIVEQPPASLENTEDTEGTEDESLFSAEKLLKELEASLEDGDSNTEEQTVELEEIPEAPPVDEIEKFTNDEQEVEEKKEEQEEDAHMQPLVPFPFPGLSEESQEAVSVSAQNEAPESIEEVETPTPTNAKPALSHTTKISLPPKEVKGEEKSEVWQRDLVFSAYGGGEQVELKALFNLEETIDIQGALQLAAELQGVEGIVLINQNEGTAEGYKGNDSEEAQYFLENASSIYHKLIALTDQLGISDAEVFSLKTEHGTVSFFTEEYISMGVLQPLAEEAPIPGLREKLTIVARELDKMVKSSHTVE